jgi:hypothetical protein
MIYVLTVWKLLSLCDTTFSATAANIDYDHEHQVIIPITQYLLRHWKEYAAYWDFKRVASHWVICKWRPFGKGPYPDCVSVCVIMLQGGDKNTRLPSSRQQFWRSAHGH